MSLFELWKKRQLAQKKSKADRKFLQSGSVVIGRSLPVPTCGLLPVPDPISGGSTSVSVPNPIFGDSTCETASPESASPETVSPETASPSSSDEVSELELENLELLQVQNYVGQAVRPSTVKSYGIYWRQFLTFCEK